MPGLFDLLHPDHRADPYPIYHQLRSEDPVHWDDTGRWVLTRYADVAAALRDNRLSAARASTLTTDVPEALGQRLQPLTRSLSTMMLFSDPPAHTRLRRLVNIAFTPRMVEGLRPRIQQIVDDLLDAVCDAGEMDIIRDLAYPLPATVIAVMLGVPAADRDQLKQWSDDMVAFIGTGPDMSDRAEQALSSRVALNNYFRQVIAEHRKHPQSDLISALISAREHGDVLDDEELFANCSLLLTAGHETTTNLIGNGVLALLRNPDQLHLLRQDPSLIQSAVEELLRYDSPVQLTGRVAMEDITIGGKTISAGQVLIFALGAANRDPAQFPDPDRLDIARPDNRHVSFGHGIHFCLGAPLARLEGQIAIATLLRRMPDLRLTADSLQWQETIAFRGVKALPVAFRSPLARER